MCVRSNVASTTAPLVPPPPPPRPPHTLSVLTLAAAWFGFDSIRNPFHRCPGLVAPPHLLSLFWPPTRTHLHTAGGNPSLLFTHSSVIVARRWFVERLVPHCLDSLLHRLSQLCPFYNSITNTLLPRASLLPSFRLLSIPSPHQPPLSTQARRPTSVGNRCISPTRHLPSDSLHLRP